MTALLVQEAEFIHNSLGKVSGNSKARTHSILKLLQSVGQSLETAGNSILAAKTEFAKSSEDISKENNCLKDLMEFMFESVKTFGKVIQQMGRDIRVHLSEPLQTFYYDLQISNKKSIETCLEIMEQIHDNLNRLKQIEKAFENKKQGLVQKKSYFKAEESKYRGQVISTNDVWPEIQYRFVKLLEEVDSVNESRCEFTKKQVVEFSRVLNRLLQSDTIQQHLKEFQKRAYEHHQLQQAVIMDVENEFGRSQLLKPLKIFSTIKLKLQNDKEKVEKQNRIEDFSEMYLINSVQETSLETRGLILESMSLSEYFLCCICSQLHTQKSLPSDKYNDLLTLVKYIFAESMHHADNQSILYGILYLAMRIVNQGMPMIKELSKYAEYWESDNRWDSILKHIHAHVSKDYPSKKVTHQLRKASTILRRNASSKTDTAEDPEPKNSMYQSVKEVNILITQLGLKTQFSIDFIAKKCAEFGLTREQTESLLMYQQQAKKNTLDNLYFNQKSQLLLKEDKFFRNSKLGLVYAVKKCLSYLSIDSDAIYNLRLVSRKWNEYLWLPILKRYLVVEPNLNKIGILRPKLYQALIPQAYSEKLYHRMLAEVPQDFELFEQIDMDVRRSISWKPELRETLRDILVVFSFYNEKIGYLQGMNYLGETILKLPISAESAYCIFQYMLRSYFSILFLGNLENMKLKVYQLSRLMERYLPKLYKHFENEKVEIEHFLVPWIVTLWGEMQGDIVWVMWDGFLAEGWKWWTKVCLWVLGIFQADLLEMGFEDILKFFSDLSSNSFFKCKFNDFLVYAISPLKIKEDIKSIRVSRKMLDLLETEYLNSQKVYKDILNGY